MLLCRLSAALMIPSRATAPRLLLRRSMVQHNTVVADLTEENAILRNEIVRKDAIIEGLLATLSASAMTTSLDVAKHRTPLTDLCQISKEACDAVRRRVAQFTRPWAGVWIKGSIALSFSGDPDAQSLLRKDRGPAARRRVQAQERRHFLHHRRRHCPAHVHRVSSRLAYCY